MQIIRKTASHTVRMSNQRWDGSTTPSQKGKIAIVTGGNTGIGLGITRRLVECGAHVIMAGLDEPLGHQVEQEIRTEMTQKHLTDGTVEFMLVDIGSQESIRAFVNTIQTKFDHINLLINNAGVGLPTQELSTDGLPIHFGINHLGHFYLTTLLFDLLRASTSARIINVTSVAHRFEISRMMWRDTTLNFDTMAIGSHNGWYQYEQSKLLNVIFTIELDRRLRAAKIKNVLAISAHPGVCNTKIFQTATYNKTYHLINPLVDLLYSCILQTPEMGSLPLLYAATVEKVQSGQLYGPNGTFPPYFKGYPQQEMPYEEALREDYGQQLWILSERLTKTPFQLM